MELGESINTLNSQLENLYGTDFTTRQPIWRIVWSEDQFEKRLMDVSREGLTLLVPQVMEVPKYRQWIKERYVLEQLVIVPEVSVKELAGVKVSYEPMYVFQNAYNGEYLPPRMDAAKFVIDSVYAAKGKHSMRKYVDEEEKNPIEARENRITKLQSELFGEDTIGPLEHGGGVFVDATKQFKVDVANPQGDK